MGTFADLNAYSEELIEFTDLRPADVFFTVPIPSDIGTITTTDFSIPVFAPYDIIEIVQPQIALVSYSVDVSGVAGTTVTWPTVPQGSTVTAVDGVFTITGIDTLEEWATVKTPTINIPTSFNGSFFYIVSVNYNTSEGPETYSWQVGTYIPQALFESEFNQTTSATRIKGLFVNPMVASFSIFANPSVELNPATFTANFNSTATARKTASGRFNRSAVFGISVIPTVIEAVINHKITRTFDKNFSNQLFSSNPIATTLPNSGNYRVVASVSSGILYSEFDEDGDFFNNSVEFTSNNLSLLLQKITNDTYFIPNFNTANSLTYTFSLYKDNQLIGGTGTSAALNFSGTTQTLPGVYRLQSRTEFPVDAFAYQYYRPSIRPGVTTRATIVVVGGGGGGALQIAGGGGGGGGIRGFNDTSWSLVKMQNATINQLGQGGGCGTNTTFTNAGSNGTSTIAVYNGITYTALGGGGGGANADIRKGGTSFDGTFAGQGGEGLDASPSGTLYSAGGGGASGGQTGGNAFVFSSQFLVPGSGNASTSTIGGDGHSQDPGTPHPLGQVRSDFRSNLDPTYPEKLGAGGHASFPDNNDGYGNGLDGGIYIEYIGQ
jgi:hypothetical protein